MMSRASQITKIISIFVLIITLSSVLPQISQSVMYLPAEIDSSDEEIEIRDDLEITDQIDEDIYSSLVNTNSINSTSGIFGEAIRITNDKLQADEYAIILGPNDTTHCVWFQQLTHLGLSLMYSYTNDSINWITPVPIYR